jgi:hypothetical protein
MMTAQIETTMMPVLSMKISGYARGLPDTQNAKVEKLETAARALGHGRNHPKADSDPVV